jgi:hypothetical protein
MKLLTALPLLGALALISLGQTARAEHFDIDTSTIVDQSGYLDFQFNPNTDGTTPLNSNVKVYNFISDGTLGSVDTTVNVIGTLPGDVTIYNTDAENGFLQLFTFGNKLSFDTTFPDAPEEFAADEGSTFQFFALDANKNAYSTTDPSGNGALVVINQNADGSLEDSQQYLLNGPTSVPEPSSGVSLMLLSALVLIPVGLAVRKQRKAA